MNKELFYKNIHPYEQLGMVREVCSTEHLTIISLGEIVYIVCPYILAESNYALGVYMNSESIKQIIKNDNDIYPYISAVFNDIDKRDKLTLCFSPEKIDYWKKWIDNNKGINKIDYQLEEELNSINVKITK